MVYTGQSVYNWSTLVYIHWSTQSASPKHPMHHRYITIKLPNGKETPGKFACNGLRHEELKSFHS